MSLAALPLDVIDTDRPHQTDTPHVVAEGRVQAESALASAQLGGEVGATSGNRGAHLLFLDDEYRFGMAPRIELGMLFKHGEYLASQRRFAPPGPLSLRAKLNFVEGEGLIPTISLVPWVFLPFAPGQQFRGGPLFFWAWELPARLELEMNGGVLFGATPGDLVAPVLASALTWTAVGEFRVFVDIYRTGPNVQLGTGALWAFTPDMQLDMGSYIGVAGQEPVATPFLGFSIRR
jgi:hypothetical protein